MRTIKFRGKCSHSDAWVYGCFVDYGEDEIPEICGIDPYAEGDPYWRDVEIDRSTVGQFTGFKDKDGREIYDGDIIQVNGAPYHLIKWLDELGGFGLCNLVSIRMLKDWPDRCLFGIPGSGWWHDFGREIVVVGNIHDNPDYLDKFKEK